MVGLTNGEKNVQDMYNHLHTILACDRQTDRQMDGQTSCHGIVHTMHMHRAVKTISDAVMSCGIPL